MSLVFIIYKSWQFNRGGDLECVSKVINARAVIWTTFGINLTWIKIFLNFFKFFIEKNIHNGTMKLKVIRTI